MNKDYSINYITLLCLVIFINSIANTIFLTIFLVGIVFEIFIKSSEQKKIYIFIFSNFTFIYIATSYGLMLFLFNFMAFLIYYFFIPRIKHLFASHFILQLNYIFIFYFLFYCIMSISQNGNFYNFIPFLYNFMLDIFLIGLFI